MKKSITGTIQLLYDECDSDSMDVELMCMENCKFYKKGICGCKYYDNVSDHCISKDAIAWAIKRAIRALKLKMNELIPVKERSGQ